MNLKDFRDLLGVSPKEVRMQRDLNERVLNTFEIPNTIEAKLFIGNKSFQPAYP